LVAAIGVKRVVYGNGNTLFLFWTSDKTHCVPFLKYTLDMTKLLLTILLSLTGIVTFSQTNSNKNVYLKLSGGQVSFGTGDFLGYSFSFDASKNILKKSSFALDKLLLGGELIFESGVKNPVIHNPTEEQFFSKTFHHVSSTVLWTKISYYPFKKIIKGFNIQIGPTAGYSYRSTEERASRIVNALGESTRLSTLIFDNGFTYGYRISTGIEFNLNKNLLTGFRLDFSNNNEAEINTLAGIKLGIKL
jgi:hypothetical protein